MSATAISKHTINPSKFQTPIKLDRLKMSFKDQILQLQITSPYLTPYNYDYTFEKDMLILKIKPVKNRSKEFPFETTVPILIPKEDFRKVINQKFEKNTLYLELQKEHQENALHVV